MLGLMDYVKEARISVREFIYPLSLYSIIFRLLFVQSLMAGIIFVFFHFTILKEEKIHKYMVKGVHST